MSLLSTFIILGSWEHQHIWYALLAQSYIPPLSNIPRTGTNTTVKEHFAGKPRLQDIKHIG